MTLTTLKGIFNILCAVICPAYTFWRAYLNFQPDSFLWWCEVCAGVLLIIMFGVGLQNASEKITNPLTDD